MSGERGTGNGEWGLPSSHAPVPAEAAAPAVREPTVSHASPLAAPRLSPLWPWLRVVALGLLSAAALRACVFEAYRIPSPSMEGTLLVGDLLFVSKVHVGATLAGRRLPALRPPRRGDVVVFHFPPGREVEIGDRAPYIKRVVGLPGDTVRIDAKQVVVNGAPVATPPEARLGWEVRTVGGTLPGAAMAAAGLDVPADRLGPGAWLVNATADEAERLRAQPGMEAVHPYVREPGDGSASFPARLRFSLDDYGPVIVPRRGLTVTLDDDTWATYRTAIERDEGVTTERTADGFLIGGRPATRYTFRRDYYFVLGDHRDDSSDSRTWGFVPATHLIGVALLVYGSWDPDARRVRWERIGQPVE